MHTPCSSSETAQRVLHETEGGEAKVLPRMASHKNGADPATGGVKLSQLSPSLMTPGQSTASDDLDRGHLSFGSTSLETGMCSHSPTPLMLMTPAILPQAMI